jgi:glycerophosphoryl diester phosphodiesterase
MLPAQIFAHRGLWSSSECKNSRAALTAALRRGFGLETDIRDHAGELVISHDLAGDDALPLRHLLEDYRSLGATGILALNIKADGLATKLRQLVESHEISQYFVFDMSIPDMRHYDRLQVPYFSRRSEFESEIIAFDHCAGVWLDAFESDWYDADTILGLLTMNKRVAVVSPEVHGRDPRPVWELLRSIADPTKQLYCCTDHPLDLQKWMS